MKTRRQRELQAAEGVAVTPPQALEATRRNRRGGSRTTSRAPTTEPTQSQSNPVDLTLSESSEHGESQPEPAQSQPRSRPPKTRARAGKSVTRAQSKATSRAASRATSRAASRATSRAASRATTAEPAQLGSSQAEAIQIDSTESEPKPTPSEPDLPAFVKAEIVDDGHPQPDFVQSEPPLLEPHYPQTPQSEPPRLEPTLFGFSQADAIQIDSTESEPKPTPSEPDQPVFVKTEVVDDGPAQPGSMQSGPPFLEPPHPQPLQSEPPQTEPSQVEAPRLETPQIEAPQVEAPRLEAPQGEAPQVEAPRLESPQAGPSQPTTSLTPNIDNQIKQEFGAHEPSTRKRRYEDTLLYDLRTRNAEADAKRQKLGRPKTKVTEVSAKYKMYKKRTEEERKARSAETSTQGETTQTDDPGPSEDDGSTARTSPENAPANATIATGPRNRNREDDELAHRVSPSSWPANSLASKLFAASPTRGTRTTSQPDRSRKLRPTPRASKPQAPKRRPALAEVDAQSHMEEGASSQTKPDRRTVRMPKYFTGPMDNRTVLHDYSQQDVSLIESDNLSSDDESMLDLNETQEEDAEMEDQSDRSGQVGQHIQSTGGPTTPTTQATPAATAQTTKSRGWGFGSLLPSAARTVSRFLPSWRQQPASLPPSPTQQPTTVPATEPRQRQHVSATQGQGRIARKKAITYSTIAREPSGAVRLMTKGAIGATKQKADNRKTLEWRAKRAEEEKAQAVARKEREKQDITDMKDKVIASLQQQLYDAKRGVISDNPANWPRRKERVPSHPQEETLASKDSVIRSLHKQLQDVQSVSRENVRQRREAESNQGQPIDLTRPTPLEKQKRKRVASPDIIPNPVANGFGMDLNYFGFDDDDSQYFENTEEDQESSPLISKRQRTSRFSATDKAIAPLNDTATESSNLDMTPRPSPPIGNPYQATPYTGRIFSNASVSSRQDALDRLFSEDPVSDQAAEQQDTASKEPQGSQPNTFTVPSEQPASHDEPQVSQPNTFTVPSPDEDTPQVTKPNPNPFFTMSSPTFGTQDKGQVSKSLFFNMPSAQAPTQQQPQASQPNIFTMPAEQASVPEQPQVTKPNPFLSMSSPSVTTQEQPQATKPNPFFSMSTPSFLPQAPVTQPDKFNMPAVPEQQPVTKPNPFFAMSSPSVTTQEQPQATKPNPFTVPAEQASVQEQPQVTKPNPFFSMSSPSVTAQDKPQVSKPNIFNVTAEKATVEEQAARQEQPQVNKPNPFFSMSSPSVLTQDKPQVIKPFFSNLPSPSVLPQPPVSQVNTSSVPAEQATVKEKANMQEQPQVTESNPPSVLTQDKPPVSKPIFSNLPTPSFSPQPRVSQPNAFTVPSPGATDSDFSFAETPTLSSPKASAPLNASQATPTPARKHHGPVLPFDITRTTKVWTGSKRRTAPTEKPPASPEKQPAPAEKEPAPAEKRSAPAEKVLAAAEQQPAAAEQQPAAAEQQPAPATPLPPTPSDVSLARQRDQALKYAAKTPSRLHEATRPSSTNVESEGSDDQTIKSLATLAPAPVAASASFQAPTTFPPSRYKSKEERVQAAEKRMKDLGLNHYEAFLNSEEFTEEARDAHNKVLKAYPKMTNEAVKVLIKQIFDYQVWSKATTGVTGNTFDLEVPKRPHQGPLTRRGPEPRPRPPAAGPVVAETSRPVQKRQATEDVEADLDAFEDMMRRPPKRAKPAVRQGVTSYDDTSVHSQPPPPQENFRFMDFYQKVLNDFEEEDAKKMAKKGP